MISRALGVFKGPRGVDSYSERSSMPSSKLFDVSMFLYLHGIHNEFFVANIALYEGKFFSRGSVDEPFESGEVTVFIDERISNYGIGPDDRGGRSRQWGLRGRDVAGRARARGKTRECPQQLGLQERLLKREYA